MYRIIFSVNLIFITAFCFAQDIRIIGRVPSSDDNRTYQIQVGSFLQTRYAENAYERLSRASLNPVYERYNDFTRVIATGIPAAEVTRTIERLRGLGFAEVVVSLNVERPAARPQTPANIPPGSAPSSGAISIPRGGITELHSGGWPVLVEIPVSTAALPVNNLTEIGFRTIKVGETRSLTDLTVSRNFSLWINSTPSVVSIDSSGSATGLNIGNAYIQINNFEYISLAVVPREDFYTVPESQVTLLPEVNTGKSYIENMIEYKTEPTFRLSYRFNNKGEESGASGPGGGIDILARGDNYEWLWTTYYQGGWFYDLNGTQREMTDGFQKDARNGVELRVIPEFIYDKGVPYLQLRHRLHNPNNFQLTEQRFGASADIMINNNDYASLVYTPFGAYMADDDYYPTIELILVCLEADGITPVDTLWLGTYNMRNHLNNIYTDRRQDVYGEDSAVCFSYQGIDLAPGETKEFIIRFTVIRFES